MGLLSIKIWIYWTISFGDEYKFIFFSWLEIYPLLETNWKCLARVTFYCLQYFCWKAMSFSIYYAATESCSSLSEATKIG